MTNPKTAVSPIALRGRLKSFRMSAAFIFATLMLLAAAVPVATAQTYTVLFNFNGFDGMSSSGILAQGRDGNLYGEAQQVIHGAGNVFKITPDGSQKVLHRFDDADGNSPEGGLTLGTDGNFYGTTYLGGANTSDAGTIFKITKGGNLTTLYSFDVVGANPNAPPIEGSDGNFYGTTQGSTDALVYQITTSGTFSQFAELPNGGSQAPLLEAADGNFYGTAYNSNTGAGEVFKLTPRGVLTSMFEFDGTHGGAPLAPLIQGTDGNFYGTAAVGGSNGGGVVFKLTRQGVITILHNFPDPNYPDDGEKPESGLLQATDGSLYGVTSFGGIRSCKNGKFPTGCGVIFQITSGGVYSVLYKFAFDNAINNGSNMMLLQHTSGKIYGLCPLGGTYKRGFLYSLDMGLGPFVSLVSASGKVGKTVEVLGQGFTGTTAVAFNGTAATFKVVSNTYLTATVPTGATTGFVTVTTPGGALKSNKQFIVKP